MHSCETPGEFSPSELLLGLSIWYNQTNRVHYPLLCTMLKALAKQFEPLPFAKEEALLLTVIIHVHMWGLDVQICPSSLLDILALYPKYPAYLKYDLEVPFDKHHFLECLKTHSRELIIIQNTSGEELDRINANYSTLAMNSKTLQNLSEFCEKEKIIAIPEWSNLENMKKCLYAFEEGIILTQETDLLDLARLFDFLDAPIFTKTALELWATSKPTISKSTLSGISEDFLEIIFKYRPEWNQAPLPQEEDD
ncbi:MAG: hypothetical protein HY324_02005 [Chlamydiia bacterium]|nr:hypothetical protein [Chlamydiia bacterium]